MILATRGLNLCCNRGSAKPRQPASSPNAPLKNIAHIKETRMASGKGASGVERIAGTDKPAILPIALPAKVIAGQIPMATTYHIQGTR